MGTHLHTEYTYTPHLNNVCELNRVCSMLYTTAGRLVLGKNVLSELYSVLKLED